MAGLRRPKAFRVGAGRRPAPSASEGRFQSAGEADARRQAPMKADFNRRERPTPGAREHRMNSTSKASGRWPAAAGQKASRVGAGRRPAPSAHEGRFQSAGEAGTRRTGASNEFDLKGLRPMAGLRRPKAFRVGAGRRPAPSAHEGRFQSAREADARREAPSKADFQSAQGANAWRRGATRRYERWAYRRKRPGMPPGNKAARPLGSGGPDYRSLTAARSGCPPSRPPCGRAPCIRIDRSRASPALSGRC